MRYFPQVQFLDKVDAARCCTMTGAYGLTEQKTVEFPQLQCSDKGDDVSVVQVVVWVSWKGLKFSSSPEFVGLPVCNETMGFLRGFGGDSSVGFFSRSSGLSRSRAPVFGALDDEEFFFVEGSDLST